MALFLATGHQVYVAYKGFITPKEDGWIFAELGKLWHV
jgi:hypothetical protein